MLLLIPSWLDLATWAGVVFASLALIGFGRLLSAGNAPPETALIAGWGGAALLLTLWGILTPASLRWPALVVVLCGLIGQALPRLRLSAADWLSLLRLAVVALPLIAIMASARPSLPDTFLNLLPNAAYLYDHASFPADARPPAYSYLPGAPYNLQLAAFIASLITPGFPPSALIGLNLVLQLAAALLLARLIGAGEDDRRAPSWSASALGFLLAMALNPGFVPRYYLSGYSEAGVAVTLAFAGFLAARLVDRAASGGPIGMTAWLLALSLAALVNIKQDSIALVLGLLVSAALLALAARSPARRQALGALALAALPALLLYLGWRWYVLGHFAEGELKPLPVAQWQLRALPLILQHMLGATGEKIVFFGALASVFVILARRLLRRELGLATGTATLLFGVFVIYNAALVLAYVASFVGEMGTGAHSYFRYNTHLALLLMVAIVLLGRETPWVERWAQRARVRRVAPAALVFAALAAPIAFFPFLRFDLEVPQLRTWRLAQETASRIADRERLALVLPGDNGSVAAMLEGLLRMTRPRRPDIEVTVERSFDANSLAALDAAGIRLALLSCAPAGVAGVPAGAAALLERGASGWTALAAWPYSPVPRGARWSKVMAAAPLCLPG
ncbi:MAG TPA: hypothetical protein VN832_07705 [Stellaceae bacterium]|nr:hypothetical protein [Stellaceae bacterium]